MAYESSVKLKLMEAAVGIATYTPPSGLYLELVPGIERVQVTFETSGSYVTNSQAVTFPVLTSTWGTTSSVTLWDAPVGGTLFATSDYLSPSTVDLSAGTVVTFPVGSIRFG